MADFIHKKNRFTSFQIIIIGFATVVLIGALVLMLPVSSKAGIITPFNEALFTSTSAVCVTGLVLLDLGLPDMDGVEVIKKIRTWSNMPIIVISARSGEADKIEALDNGADDYLTKPFSVEELLARLRVTARRLAMLKVE